MSEVVTCAVVQGNMRYGTEQVLACLQRHFDHVVLSTWDDEIVPFGTFEVVTNQKPVVPGVSHRNYQRLSTAAGLRRARELGATHVLKWRTDMLPTKLDVAQLIRWSSFEVAAGTSSRVVSCAFRNLTLRQDWFSSVPDLFAFADIRMMELLWGDEAFDYGLAMNVPAEMTDECGVEWRNDPVAAEAYFPETELYAVFKSRLQRLIGRPLTHEQIAKDYMYLINHRRLGICWFGQGGAFRSIPQALQYPWWTEWTWRYGKPTIVDSYVEKGLIQKFRRKHLTRLVNKFEIFLQRRWYTSARRCS